jgi:ABC-type sugar transport system substrate-binding protein
VRPRVAGLLDTYPNLHIDAIFGLSDSLTLAVCATCQALGRIDSRTLILGINGNPLALAAIAEGRMTATIETDVDDIASQALDLAYRAARGEQLPQHFQNDQRLVTVDNVAEVAMRKLISLASLPTRLMDVNQRHE